MSPAPRFVSLQVLDVVDETSDARSFVLEIPEGEAAAFGYEAGQYCTFRVETDSGRQLRCYSMSSSPDLDEPFRTTIKRVPDGIVSNWLLDRIRPGDVLEATPPAGVFCLDPADTRPIVAFAGGSGVTPVVSIVKTAMATTDRSVGLLFANRDAESVILRSELELLAAQHPGRFTLVHHLDDASGYLDPDAIVEFVGADLDVAVYLCGPTPFMDLVEATLGEIGHDPELVRTERFVTAEAVPPELAAAEGANARGAIELTLAGARHTIEHHSGETILEAARRGGLQPPFSCQAGNCATCIAELTDGEVQMRVNDVLTPDELADGWILTCQSELVTTAVSVVYPD